MNKKISEEQFKDLMRLSKNISVTGFRWSGTPQLLLRLTREIFDEEKEPNNVSIIFTSSPTDPGIDYLAHPKLLSCSFGSYYGSIPKIRNLVQNNLIEGYSLPQGQISLLFREIARGGPGIISKVGLNTYVDPDLNGGKLNKITIKDVVKKINIDDEEYLLYKPFNIDTALIRGTIADKHGNISMKNEPIKTEFLSMAQATKTLKGKVYVQVCEENSEVLSPAEIDLPSHLVDGYLVTNDPENDHRQTNKFFFHDDFLSRSNQDKELNDIGDPSYKKIIAKNALKYISSNLKIVIGQGIPELVGVSLRKNNKLFKNFITFMESGVIGGIPERRPDFGVAFGPSSFLTQDNQFVGFNGGHMDVAILSFVEFDKFGNVNVSVLGNDYYGCGGYIDICHSVKTILFVGSFTAKGLQVENIDNKIFIKKEGTIFKAVKNVKEITFSPISHNKNKKIFIITERCIFSVEDNKIILKEVYDGIDIQKDVLDKMEFIPEIDDKIIINKEQ